MKRKSLYKIFSVLLVALLLFVILISTVSAFAFQNDVGLPVVPTVSQVYANVNNGENVFEYPITYTNFPYRYSNGSSNTLQTFRYNYRNYLQRTTDKGIEFITDSYVYYDPASFIITTIDFGYSNTVDALYSVSVDSDSYYVKNDDYSTLYNTSSGGGWVYFVFADNQGNLSNLRIDIENGAFNDTFYLSSLYDDIYLHFENENSYKYLLQVQIKQNFFSGANVPSFVPMYKIKSTVTIGKNYLDQFQEAFLNIVNNEIDISYQQGFSNGELEGYNNGYNSGYDIGFQDGFELGEDVVDDGWYGWLIEAVDAFLNTPLFYVYDTAVSLGGLCGIFVGISVILWVLKLIAGG